MRRACRRQLALLAFVATVYGRVTAPEAIVHVGPHKTGSTSIQIALLKIGPLRDALTRRDGFHIPLKVPGRYGGHKAHANIAAALLSENATTHPAWVHFLAHAKNAARAGRRLFISSENFSSILNKGNLKLFIVSRRATRTRTPTTRAIRMCASTDCSRAARPAPAVLCPIRRRRRTRSRDSASACASS